MPTIKLDKTTMTIDADKLAALRWRAHEYATAVGADKTKTDAIKTVSLTVDDGGGPETLVVPAAVWDKMMTAMGVEPGAPAEPMADMPSGDMPMPMDSMGGKAKTDAASKPVDVMGDVATDSAALASRLAKLEDETAAAKLRARAQPLVGDRHLDGLGSLDVLLAPIGLLTDSAAKLPRARELAQQVKTDSSPERRGIARGRLEAMFEQACDQLEQARKSSEVKTDSADSIADLLRPRVKTDAAKPDRVTAAELARTEREKANYLRSIGKQPAA